MASQVATSISAWMLATSGRSRLARGLLQGAAMELFFSLLDNLVALAVAVELVGVGILIHRKLR